MPARVVFLPGAGGDPGFWTPVVQRLPSSLDTVQLGWPGLGREKPRDDVRGLDDLVRLTLEALADSRSGPAPPGCSERRGSGGHVGAPSSIVAQSMGGVVALLATLARPALVERLVLVATSGGVDVQRFGAADWRPDYRREYPDAAPWIGDVRVDLSARLSTIAIPTLLLWGSADRISPVAVGGHLATLLPAARLVVIPGGDHGVARDRADLVAPHVARHLELA